jgi:hypothetical protein
MLTVQNAIGIKLGNFLQGSAEGPLGIGALLIITAMLLVWMIAMRRGRWCHGPPPLIVRMHPGATKPFPWPTKLP